MARRLRVAIWVTLCSAFATPAAALEWDVGVFAAPHYFNVANELGQPEGWTGGIGSTVYPGLRGGVRPWRWLSLEAEFGYGRSTTQTIDLKEQSTDLLTLRGHAIGRFELGRWALIALAGGGVMRTAPATLTALTKADTDPYGYVGPGIEFAGSDNWQVRLDARLHATGSAVVGRSTEQEAEATVAFSWRFGGDRKPGKPADDEDEDGIADAVDRCPYDAETPNGVRDDDGCPEDPVIAKQVHQTRYVQRDNAQVAILPKESRAAAPTTTRKDEPKSVAPPVTLTVTTADEQALEALGQPVELADNALPPLVGPGDDDFDGFPRADDVCPDNAEDADGFEDLDGCPDPDNDADGLNDTVDRCPFDAETPNGVRDDDGCPEDPTLVQRYHQTRYAQVADSQVAVLPTEATPVDVAVGEPGAATPTVPAASAEDGERQLALLPDALPLAPNALPPLMSAGDDDKDGFARDFDVCPDRPEDKDNFEDDDGCPDYDDDKDGVPDRKDKCRREGETRNGYDDDDGCPDDVPVPLAERVGVIQGMVFAVNSAEILPSSVPRLKRVSQVLNRFEQAQVEIAGHTDNVGDQAKNVELSKRRAESVRAWLIQHGADAARINAVGYGPSKPKASNASRAGQARNRRVEFNLVTAPTRSSP
ncbi:MAG: OmpA family protein [Myxococcales bacterium]|nr:OmpA family protein [Myxococcales bacterium]